MPPLETADHNDKIAYWQRAGFSDSGISHTYSPPIELTGRWEELTAEQVSRKIGIAAVSVAFYCSQKLIEGSLVQKGSVFNVSESATIYEVVRTKTITSLRGHETQYTAYLKKYGNTKPEILGLGTGT